MTPCVNLKRYHEVSWKTNRNVRTRSYDLSKSSHVLKEHNILFKCYKDIILRSVIVELFKLYELHLSELRTRPPGKVPGTKLCVSPTSLPVEEENAYTVQTKAVTDIGIKKASYKVLRSVITFTVWTIFVSLFPHSPLIPCPLLLTDMGLADSPRLLQMVNRN